MGTTNKFVEASNKERELLTLIYESNGVTDYFFTPSNGMDRYEGEFTTNGKTYVVEVKNRNNTSAKFPTTLIEESKVNYLRNKCKEENKVPLLFVFFTDGKFLMFNLNHIKEEWKSSMYCNRTTAVASGKVSKKVFLIPITFDLLRDTPTKTKEDETV